MPDPAHKDMTTQSEELRALLDAQRPTPRWLYRLRRWLRGLFAVLLIAAASPSTEAQPLDLDRLIPALEQVESGGNPNARGDGNRAWGILQIWEVVIIDVNRVHRTSYVHKDAFDPAKAREICRLYLGIYCTAKRLGRQPTMEDAARMWNGGPNGHRKTATISYWQKVQRAL
jgi:hypothetical protein